MADAAPTTHTYRVTTAVRGQFDHLPTSDDIAGMLEQAARSIRDDDPSDTIIQETISV